MLNKTLTREARQPRVNSYEWEAMARWVASLTKRVEDGCGYKVIIIRTGTPRNFILISFVRLADSLWGNYRPDRLPRLPRQPLPCLFLLSQLCPGKVTPRSPSATRRRASQYHSRSTKQSPSSSSIHGLCYPEGNGVGRVFLSLLVWVGDTRQWDGFMALFIGALHSVGLANTGLQETIAKLTYGRLAGRTASR